MARAPIEMQTDAKAKYSHRQPKVPTATPAMMGNVSVPMPTPVVALNRAVAVAELEGPVAALHEIDALDLDTYHLFHSTRADLLGRLGRYDEARDAYERALALTANAAEHTLLARKRDALPRA